VKKTCPSVTFFTTNPTYRLKNKVLGIIAFLILFFGTPLYLGDFMSIRIACKVFYDKNDAAYVKQ